MSLNYPGGFITKNPVTPNVYTASGMWSLDQAMQNTKNASWPGGPETNFKYVTSLLHGDGINNANNNVFLDSSSNNFAITRYGNTTQGSFSPYSPVGVNWSGFFPGSSGTNFITLSADASLGLGTGQFCIDVWVFEQNTSSGSGYGISTIMTQGNNNNNTFWGWYINSSTRTMYWGFTGSGVSTSSSYPVPKNKWTHLAVSRDASNIERIFVDGVLINQRTNTSNYNGVSSYQTLIGCWNDTNYPGAYGISSNCYVFNGYMNNLRMTIGSIPPEYQTTSTTIGATIFTPPYTVNVTSDTKLLAFQNNYLKDNSSYNRTLSVTGSNYISKFSPNTTKAGYDPSTISGSLYFDGSGDYLSLPSDNAWAIGSTATIEGWFYVLSWGGNLRLFCVVNDTTHLDAYIDGYGRLGIHGGNILTSASVPLNCWTHIAIVYNAGSVTIYFNGILQSVTGTTTGYNVSSTGTLYIGQFYQGSYNYNGYICDFRILKGTALYTSTFTPPIAKLPPIANTQLLLSGTNSGIIDNSGMIDLETVGGVKITTSNLKYGTGCLSFDGSSYINIPYNSLNYFADGDFTIEMWTYTTSTQSACTYDFWVGTTYVIGQYQIYYSSNVPVFYIAYGSSSYYTLTSSITLTNNTWNHVALVRSGSTIYFYINGIQSTNTLSYSGVVGITSYNGSIGRQTVTNNNYFTGLIDDLRITKGLARYTNNFTVPTGPHPNK